MNKRNIVVDNFNTRQMNVSLSIVFNCLQIETYLIIFTLIVKLKMFISIILLEKNTHSSQV